MIKSRSKEATSVYFRGVSIAKIIYHQIMVWGGSTNNAEDLSCFNNGSSAWNDELPWNDDANWID